MMHIGVCNCFALYDWEGRLDRLELYDVICQFFETLKVKPNVIAARLGAKSTKIRSMHKLKEKITEATSIDLYQTLPDYAQLVFGWDIYVHAQEGEVKTVLFCWDNEIRKWEKAYINQLACQLSTIAPNYYGTAYQRSFKKGPAFYPFGMIAGLDFSDNDSLEIERISSWMHSRYDDQGERAYKFRDIYPVNILSKNLLLIEVGGLPLLDWVDMHQYGVVTKLKEELYSWAVPESKIKTVRNAFLKEKLLVFDE